MTQLGVRYTDTELDDIIHLWRCVGHLIGVERFGVGLDRDHPPERLTGARPVVMCRHGSRIGSTI